MKKYALHEGHRVRISDNSRAVEAKSKEMSVDAIVNAVTNKFPTHWLDQQNRFTFAAGVPIHEVVLFIRKLSRRRK